MRLTKNICVLSIFLIALTGVTFSQSDEVSRVSNNATATANYISGLYSDNQTLRVNSAYMLGELKSERAVVPLMDMFRSEKNSAAKLVAALSLLKIGDPRGIFLLKRNMELKRNDGINIILKQLYYDFVKKTKEI